MCKLQKSNQEQRKTLNSLAHIFISPRHGTSKLYFDRKKCAIAATHKRWYNFNKNHGISFLRELDNNWINELPPGVFNNNIELIELWVTDIHTISLSFLFFFRLAGRSMRHTLYMFYEVQRKKRNKKRLLATFVTSIHFQIKGSLLTLTKDSVNVDNDVLKATWLDDKDRNFVKSCWYSVYE